jgi:hypothetical protein
MLKYYGRNWGVTFSFSSDPAIIEAEKQNCWNTVNNLQWLAYHDGLAHGVAIGVACGLLFSFLLPKIR